MKIIFTIAAYC